MAKIIIIEDTETIREELKTFLTKYGYEIVAPINFQNIIEYTLKEEPDLILLDINLPVFDGYYICREIRKSSDVPIIVVTSRDNEIDELMSMNLGADDFITKPYNTQVLLARITSILRRVHGYNNQDIIIYNDLKLNLSNGSIIYRGNSVEVTKNEIKILSCLIKNKGKIVSRDDLMDFMWNTVRRSFKDYSIYFLTLTFAVCIFYSFNSIEAQNSMLEISKSTAAYMSTLNKLIAGASIFVAFILGGLIAYANNFLIKKRKRELGIYMTLGMSKGKISKIIIIETILIGLISLVVGIVLGIIVSQGLSILTAKLLLFNITKYKFIVSVSAILKTAIYFSIMYILVMLLNQRTIKKYKLIDMLNASKKNEKVKLSSPFLSISIFLMSVVTLVIAYVLILKVGLNSENILFTVSIMMGMIGTLLFFFSLSNFFIHAIKRNKNIYFKDLNIFVFRQINNKINTNFLSMSVICLMIFLTITLLFTMFSFKGSYDKLVKGNTSFDGSIQLYINQDDQKVKDIQEYMDVMDFKYNNYENHVIFKEYKLNMKINDLLSKYLTEQEKKDFAENYIDGPISAIKTSEYNSILELKGQSPINISEDQVFVVSNYEQMNSALDLFMENENTINIDNKIFTIKNEVPIKENIITTGSYLNFFYLIVPDDFSGELTLHSTGFNVMFEDKDSKQSEEVFSNFLNDISENEEYRSIQVMGYTIELVNLRVHGSTTMIVFLGVYLGIVFLVSSAAVLALQQLSDISDSLDRYKSLKKIGVTNQLIDKAIFQQNFIYFMIPLGLAIIHSIIGMFVTNKIFSAYNSSLIGSSSLMISLVLVIIYGGYFYATYVCSKNIVRNISR